MSSFVDFLRSLLEEGEVILAARPQSTPAQRQEARTFLEATYADYRLDVAGPPLDFHADTALWAGGLVWHACWYLLNHDEPAANLERDLAAPQPASAAQHLSADLVLRYLPQVHRRARALAPADRLTRLLAVVLRQWPLTGVLSDVEDGPGTPLEFDGHPGLLLLYAERLARTEKPAWVPAGRAFEYVELVFGELGKERSALLLRRGAEEHRE